jgi:hypothetical protein
MKRGVVMEIKRKKAVILTENGRFQTIRFPKEKTSKIGEEVEISAKGIVSAKGTKRWFPVMAAAVVIFIFTVLLSGFYPLGQRAAAYVSYDVNPSFSAAVNSDLRVISIKTWNQDAADLFADWDSYQNMTLGDFTKRVMEAFDRNGYLSGQPDILIATAIVADDKQKQKKINASLQNTIKNLHSGSLLNYGGTITIKSSDYETRKKANKKGLTLGKYLLYLEAKDRDKDLSIDTVKQLPISDIEKKIKSGPVVRKGQVVPEKRAKSHHNGNHQSQRTKTYSLKKSDSIIHNVKKGITRPGHRQKAEPLDRPKHFKIRHSHKKPKHHDIKPKAKKVRRSLPPPSAAKNPPRSDKVAHPLSDNRSHHKKTDQRTKVRQLHHRKGKH